MTTRRGGRPPQVRPRPPGGRNAPSKSSPRPSSSGRSVRHRPVDRRAGLPLVAKLLLGVAVLSLGGLALFTATGGLGNVVAGIGGSIANVLENLTATPTPRPSPGPVVDAPSLSIPEEPYTNEATADLVITVPPELVGEPDVQIRIYLALGDQQAVPIEDVPLPAQTPPQVIVPVTLEKGANTFTATLVSRAGAESEPSAAVRYVLDLSAPRITLSSPKDGATVNGRVVNLVGKTQGRSQLVARNEANNRSVPGTAAADGTFTLTLPLATGTNGITITSTDPAGNTGELVLAVKRGAGRLTAALVSSIYRISRGDLPQSVELTVSVSDPDGTPLEGARATFTISVPGIRTITAEAVTAGDGRASFQTTIPRGATRGQGLATVLVRTTAHGNVSDQTVLTIGR
jgi:hypothetical protein